MKTKRWKILQNVYYEILPDNSVSTLAQRVMAARAAEGFKFDSGEALNRLHDPMLLKGMREAVEALHRAISEDRLICVYGDYDCDGVAATAMTVDYFQNIGAKVCYYIPDRVREGYGLNKRAIDDLFRLGVHLILTVDNGVSSYDEVLYANSLGIQVVITDHHTPPDKLPKAVAVVNPHQTDCTYPFSFLSGVGVAFKLLSALEGETGYELLEHYADLLTIGTIADVVDLADENCVFVTAGLNAMQESNRIGIEELMKAGNFTSDKLTSESIGFFIAPRLNAAGRLDSAELAVMLLLSQQQQEAQDLAEKLESLNSKRKQLENQVLDDVAKQVSSDPLLSLRRVMVLWGDNWNEGVLGIACSRLSERFEKPVILFSKREDGIAKGSGRSVEGFSMIEAITHCKDYLEQFGGHPMAAGMSVKSENLQKLSDAVNVFAKSRYPIMPSPVLTIDCVLSPAFLTLEQAQSLDALQPFGNGNPPPLFGILGASINKITPLSGGKHSRIEFLFGNEKFFGFLFFVEPQNVGYSPGDSVDVAFTLSWGKYKEQANVTLKIIDIHPAGFDTEEIYASKKLYECCRLGENSKHNACPSRDEVADVYRFLTRNQPTDYEPDSIYIQMLREGNIDYVRMRVAIDALIELNLILVEDFASKKVLIKNPVPTKNSLENSFILRSLSASL